MADLAGKKLPTIEQVETIINDGGTTSMGVLAERLGLEPTIVKATLDCLRQLRRMPEGATVPAIACYRDDSLESIVRCAGSKYGYV
jgi:hypothetical protein